MLDELRRGENVQNRRLATWLTEDEYEGFEIDWVGTRDASAQMVLPAALRFRQRFSERQVQAYNNALVVDFSNGLATEWRTTVGGPSEMTAQCGRSDCQTVFTVSKRPPTPGIGD